MNQINPKKEVTYMRKSNDRTRLILFLLLLVITMPPLTACTKHPVKVAVIARLESGSIMGMSTWDQIKFYQSRHAEQAKKVTFVPYNDDGTWEGIKNIYEDLRSEGISIIITAHKSDSGIWINELANQDPEPVLILASGSTTEKLTGLDDSTIRFVQSASHEQKAAAEYIKNGGYKRPVIIRDIENASYAITALEAFKQYYGKDFHWFDIHLGQIDFITLKKQLETIDYDIAYLLISDYNISAGAVAQLITKVNPEAKVLYNAWMKTQALLDTAGNSIKKSAMLSHYAPYSESPAIAKYIDDYRTMFAYTPNTIGLTVYNIVEIIHNAVDHGYTTPEGIKRYLLDEKTFETELSTVTFDTFGDSTGSFYTIENILEEFQ